MTDLTKAIEELRRIAGSKTDHFVMPLYPAFETVMNAALSGDLISRADADLAVAWRDGDAVDARLLAALRSGGQADEDGCLVIVSREACENAADIIEALTARVESALAELQALRDGERLQFEGLLADATKLWGARCDAVTARAEAAEAERDHLSEELGITEGMLISERAELATLRAQVERLTGLIRWAHDTLWELNPINYSHDDVCQVNDAAVEVILGLAPVIGETHGHSDEWWADRAALTEGAAPSPV